MVPLSNQRAAGGRHAKRQLTDIAHTHRRSRCSEFAPVHEQTTHVEFVDDSGDELPVNEVAN